MEFKLIDAKEFDDFSKNHEQASFYQTSSWANLKISNGWKPHYIAIIKNNEIIAASLLLAKQVVGKFKIFYAPRGFILDYTDKKLLTFFVENTKRYLKQNHGIFLKIDPNVIYQSRDINGELTNEINNKKIIDYLKGLNFIHFGFNTYQETMQPRWTFAKNLQNETIDDTFIKMDRITKQIIKKNEKNFIKTRFIEETELPLFKDIMQKTGDRRDFIDRPLSYYQEMYHELNPHGMIKIMIAELEVNHLINYLKEEIEKNETDLKQRQDFYENNKDKMSTEKYLKKQEELLFEINNFKKRLTEATTILEKHGNIIPLSGVLFLLSKYEIIALVGGSYEEFMDFKAPYTIHWEMIKYGITNNYNKYNFYGITGDFNKKNPLYGLYLFKKGFDGYVEELIGEFDLVINKPLYYSYKISFYIYQKLKNIQQKIKK